MKGSGVLVGEGGTSEEQGGVGERTAPRWWLAGSPLGLNHKLGSSTLPSFLFLFCFVPCFPLLPVPQICCGGEGMLHRERREGRQPLEVLAAWVAAALVWNWGLMSSVFSDASPHPKTRWLFLRLGSHGQSLLSQCERLRGATVTHCWRQGFPLNPAKGAASNLLFAPTHHAFSLQTRLPKESNRAVVWTFQIPGMAWEYRPQTKRRRRRDTNLAPD